MVFFKKMSFILSLRDVHLTYSEIIQCWTEHKSGNRRGNGKHTDRSRAINLHRFTPRSPAGESSPITDTTTTTSCYHAAYRKSASRKRVKVSLKNAKLRATINYLRDSPAKFWFSFCVLRIGIDVSMDRFRFLLFLVASLILCPK
jgi:hypothetical protein